MEFKFAGLNIYSKKPVETLAFYKKLGFRVLEEPDSDNQWYGAMLALQDDDNEPVIWIWRLSEDAEITACNHFVFTTNGKLNETYERIKSAGIACDPPFTAVWGGQELNLTDPDGNQLLFL
jgi:catechol 2,3-dioxygenase-like lactoylglutathione lyase family enzyme